MLPDTEWMAPELKNGEFIDWIKAPAAHTVDTALASTQTPES